MGPASLSSRAVVLDRFNTPLVPARFDVGKPPAGGAVVRVGYAGICGTDLHLSQGHLPIPIPLVLGHEGLGVIHGLHPELRADARGDALEIGDIVMWASSISCGGCEECAHRHEPTLCQSRKTYGVNRSLEAGEPLSGAWADYISLEKGTTIVRMPPDVDPVAAMALGCAGPTMVHAFERRPVRPGEVVIVQGAGPVGLAAAAIARLSGAGRVILLGGPAYRLRMASQCGFGDVHIDVGAEGVESAVTQALRATPEGKGADLVVECAGVPSAVEQSLRLARRGGSCLIVGQYTDGGPTTFNPHQIVYRQLDVMGSWAFSGAHLMKYVDLLPALAERFSLAALVSLFPLGDANAALDAVRRGEVVKAVLDCRDANSKL